jgi:hypothetical protein
MILAAALLAVLTLVVLTAAGEVGAVTGAAGWRSDQPVRKKVSAHMQFVVANCGWSIGPEFSAVPGAVSYEVSFWDGYYKQVIVISKTTQELKDAAAQIQAHPTKGYSKTVAGIGTSSFYIGYTGGGGGTTSTGGCAFDPKTVPGGGEPTEGGRFDKGATAYAIFPSGYKPKPSIAVSIAAPAKGTKVGETFGASVKVTAGLVPLTSVRLGSGLQVASERFEITSGPGAVAGFALGAGASRTFTYTLKALKKGTGTLSLSVTADSKRGSVKGSATARVEVVPAIAIAGTVLEDSCADKSCNRLPLPGVTVRAAGPIRASAVTDKSGKYSIVVEKGTYDVSASLGSHEFDPDTIPNVVVDDKDITGQDFETCAVESSRSTASAAAKATKPCFSTYTVKIAVSIPQKSVVDWATPRLSFGLGGGTGSANPDGSGYPISAYGTFYNWIPPCDGDLAKRIATAGQTGTPVVWRSRFIGAGARGNVFVEVRHYTDGHVSLGRVLREAGAGTLTKVYDLELGGRQYSCSVTRQWRAVAGASVGQNTFTIGASWPIPFKSDEDYASVKGPRSTVTDELSALEKKAIDAALALYPPYYTWTDKQKDAARKACYAAAKKYGVKRLKDFLEALEKHFGGKIPDLPAIPGLDKLEFLEVTDYGSADIKVTGRFRHTEDALGGRTQHLFLDVTSDAWPAFSVRVLRNDAELPWVPGESPPKGMLVTVDNPFKDVGGRAGAAARLVEDGQPASEANLQGGPGAKGTLNQSIDTIRNLNDFVSNVLAAVDGLTGSGFADVPHLVGGEPDAKTITWSYLGKGINN